MKNKGFLGAVLLVILAATILILSSEKEVAQKVTLRLKWLPYSGFAVHYVAKEKGCFASESVDVEIQPGGPGVDPIRLVVAGASDFGLASYDQILTARSKGIPIVALSEDTSESGVGFISLKSSGITTPQDFIDKKVGTLPGTDKHSIYEAMMAAAKVPRVGINEIATQFNMALLFNKEVDVLPAFISNQPIIARHKGYEVNIIDPKDFGIKPGGNVIFTTEKFLSTNQEIVAKFLKGEVCGHGWAKKLKSEEVVEIVKKYAPKTDTKMEVEIWDMTKKMLLNFGSQVGVMNERTWRRTLELFKTNGLLPEKATSEGAFDNRYILEAHDK